jgi:hypothetical protein
MFRLNFTRVHFCFEPVSVFQYKETIPTVRKKHSAIVSREARNCGQARRHRPETEGGQSDDQSNGTGSPGARLRPGLNRGELEEFKGTMTMRSKAAAVISALLYTQGLLGFAALAAVLLKHPDPAHTRDAVSTLSVKNSTVAARAG